MFCEMLKGQAFRFITALEHMDLSCNKEAGGGLSTLAANLLLLTHLRSLDMHLCCLTKDDVLTLGKTCSFKVGLDDIETNLTL